MRTLSLVLLLYLVAAFPVNAFALGETATDFTLKDARGVDFRLGDHLGKKVIIMTFWMTWCMPCLVEMPQLEKLYKKHKDKGLLVVSINADDPSGVAKAKTIARRKGLTYPVLFDSATKVTGIYNSNKQFPCTLIIGKDKKIAYVKTSFSAGDEKILEQKVLDLLGADDAK